MTASARLVCCAAVAQRRLGALDASGFRRNFHFVMHLCAFVWRNTTPQTANNISITSSLQPFAHTPSEAHTSATLTNATRPYRVLPDTAAALMQVPGGVPENVN